MERRVSLLRVLEQPWQLIRELMSDVGCPLPQTCEGGAAIALLPKGAEPMISGASAGLPRRCAPFGTRTELLSSYDLPWPTTTGETLHVQDSRGQATWDIIQHGYLARPTRSRIRSYAQVSTKPPDLALYDFLSNLVRNAQELRWTAEEQAIARESGTNAGNRALLPLPWRELPERLENSVDQPMMGLIVRVANEFSTRLFRLCEHPRRVLSRVRQKAPIGRVQQVDAACLQWLVRQPGRTASEKAGGRQRILAVEREENFDTLENRVLKDMLRRCVVLAGQWLHDNRRHHTHEKYKLVETFQRRCQRQLREPLFGAVGALQIVPSPNYVLQHDPGYRELWQWYLRIVQQEDDTDAVWPWQSRLWSETVRLYLAAAVLRLVTDDQRRLGMHHHQLWIRQRPEYGRWLADVDWPGPLIIEHRGRQVVAECLEPAGMTEKRKYLGTDLAPWVGVLGVDFAIHFSILSHHRDRQDLCLMVWGVHSSKLRTQWQEDLQVMCRDASQRLSLIQKAAVRNSVPCRFAGLMVLSDYAGTYSGIDALHCEEHEETQVHGLRAPGKPDEWGRDLMKLLREHATGLLELVR